jgi:hypothetical protein
MENEAILLIFPYTGSNNVGEYNAKKEYITSEHNVMETRNIVRGALWE